MSEPLANEPVQAVRHLRAAYQLAPDPAEHGEIAGVLSRMLILTDKPPVDDSADKQGVSANVRVGEAAGALS